MPSGALARHPVSLAGVVLTTAGAVGFITLLVALLAGLFANPYAAIVVFVAMPALVVLGLLLIPFGMWLEHRRLARHPDAAREWFVVDFRSPATRRRVLLIVALTAVNATIVLLAGYGALSRSTIAYGRPLRGSSSPSRVPGSCDASQTP